MSDRSIAAAWRVTVPSARVAVGYASGHDVEELVTSTNATFVCMTAASIFARVI